MLTQIENTKGIISFDTSLADQLILDSLAKYKGNFKILRKSSEMRENGVYIYINVYLKFGQSISEFSNDIFASISHEITEHFELPLDTIELNISGIYSKKLSKRNIVIEYNGKSEITSNRD